MILSSCMSTLNHYLYVCQLYHFYWENKKSLGGYYIITDYTLLVNAIRIKRLRYVIQSIINDQVMETCCPNNIAPYEFISIFL